MTKLPEKPPNGQTPAVYGVPYTSHTLYIGQRHLSPLCLLSNNRGARFPGQSVRSRPRLRRGAADLAPPSLQSRAPPQGSARLFRYPPIMGSAQFTRPLNSISFSHTDPYIAETFCVSEAAGRRPGLRFARIIPRPSAVGGIPTAKHLMQPERHAPIKTPPGRSRQPGAYPAV
jgi:hypothetical protein